MKAKLAVDYSNDNCKFEQVDMNCEGCFSIKNKDAYKCTLKEFGLNKMQWPCEYEQLYKGTHEVLELLHRRYKLGIIANQVLGTEQRLSNFGIRHFFDVIAASAEENVSKPNFKTFSHCTRKSKLFSC